VRIVDQLNDIEQLDAGNQPAPAGSGMKDEGT
jgi:hypothetical protein